MKSHLGLAWRCVRRGRAGVGAAQDCSELGVELGEPLVLALQLLRLRRPSATSAAPALRLRQATAEPGQRGVIDRFIETAFTD